MALLQKLILFCAAAFWALGSLFAQSHQNTSQFSVVSENDCYTSIDNDGYYTNGVRLSYQWRSPESDSFLKKKIHSIEIGQFLYNAEDAQYGFLRIDRPITGYLFANYQQSRFSPKEHMLRWKVEAGAIGPPALGRQTQKIIHDWWNIYEARQWRYQMNSGVGLTGTVSWHPETNQSGHGKYIGLKPVAGASLGNMFTNAMIGSALLIGKFNKNSSTAFWGNHFSSNKKQRELFVYVYPAMYLQAYNATVQGNLFSNKTETIEGKLNPFFFQGRAGAAFAASKYSLGFAVVYENKQSLTQRKGQVYGSIQLGVRW